MNYMEEWRTTHKAKEVNPLDIPASYNHASNTIRVMDVGGLLRGDNIAGYRLSATDVLVILHSLDEAVALFIRINEWGTEAFAISCDFCVCEMLTDIQDNPTQVFTPEPTPEPANDTVKMTSELDAEFHTAIDSASTNGHAFAVTALTAIHDLIAYNEYRCTPESMFAARTAIELYKPETLADDWDISVLCGKLNELVQDHGSHKNATATWAAATMLTLIETGDMKLNETAANRLIAWVNGQYDSVPVGPNDNYIIVRVDDETPEVN